ncbi:hypothetical protein ACP4OV_021921 [Aristida adscensionis]
MEGQQQMTFTMAASLFHCQACLHPIKPPTFLCAAGHVVCGTCRVNHGEACAHAAAYAPCPAFDAVVRGATRPCQYAEFGCEAMVVYHEAGEHHGACPWAPCSCPAPGCESFTSPPRLVEHFGRHHQRPVTGVRYGRPSRIAVPAPSHGCHVLTSEADGSVFLVCSTPCTAGAGAGAGVAVSLVCVRASGAAAAAARFWCKLSVEVPGDTDRMAMITSLVASSDLSGGFPTTERGMFLVVPPVLLHGAELSVRIDRVVDASMPLSSPAHHRRGAAGGCSSEAWESYIRLHI